MEHIVTAEKRTETGKGPNNRLRSNGMLPAIMYGNAEPLSLAINERAFSREFKHVTESTIIKLKVGKASHDVLIKDYQEDFVTGKLLHIDFYEVEAGKKLRTNIPVHLEGTPQEVREGALLETQMHEVEVECLPKDLVDVLTVDITGLSSAHALHVGDIQAPAGIKIISNADAVVAAVVHHKEKVETEEAEEAVAEEASEE